MPVGYRRLNSRLAQRLNTKDLQSQNFTELYHDAQPQFQNDNFVNTSKKLQKQ